MERIASPEKSNTEKKKCFEKSARHVMTYFTLPTHVGLIRKIDRYKTLCHFVNEHVILSFFIKFVLSFNFKLFIFLACYVFSVVLGGLFLLALFYGVTLCGLRKKIERRML
jgi:hypothetical protein